MTGRLLAPVGTISYNGFVFPSATTSRIQSVPTYNNGRTSLKYVTYTLTIESIIYVGDAPEPTLSPNLDSKLETIRSQLTTPGGALIFTEQGFGEVLVNVPAGSLPEGASLSDVVYDSTYGPHPTLLVWEPVGSQNACRIVWTVEARIPESSDFANNIRYRNEISELTFEVSWSISNEGMTTRTCRGTIELRANFLNLNRKRLTDHVDNYLEKFKPEPVPGFHREWNRHMSRDNRVLEFTVIDTEIASNNPYFPYMLQMDVQHYVSSTLTIGFEQWSNVIDGTIRYRAGIPPVMAWFAFSRIVAQRYAYAVSRMRKIKGQKQDKDVKGYPIPEEITFNEHLYDREMNFTFRYRTFHGVNEVFNATGLMQAILGTDWLQWSNSMTATQNSLGYAGMRTTDMELVNKTPDSREVPALNNIAFKAPQWLLMPLLDYNCPPPESSYDPVSQNAFTLRIDPSTIEHRPAYSGGDGEKTPGSPSEGRMQSPSEGMDLTKISQSQAPPQETPIYQQYGHAKYTLVQDGFAVRYCYPIPPPIINKVGSMEVKPKKPLDFKSRVVPGVNGMKVYYAWWHFEYDLPSLPPGDLLTLINTDGLPEVLR